MKTIWRCEHWPWAKIVFHPENIVVGIVFLTEELSMFLSFLFFLLLSRLFSFSVSRRLYSLAWELGHSETLPLIMHVINNCVISKLFFDHFCTIKDEKKLKTRWGCRENRKQHPLESVTLKEINTWDHQPNISFIIAIDFGGSLSEGNE